MQKLIQKLTAIVGPNNILTEPDELIVYECDGLPQHKYRPQAVVFPANTDETSAVMRALFEAKVPYTPRGAGTGLSGGALALQGGVLIEMARMRQILKIDPTNRRAIVQPGVVNLQVSKAAAPYNLYYVPDPSSQPTCTIGGNIAESAGGVHCLKYGTTTDHVLGCRVVLSDGTVVDLGSDGIDVAGYDLIGTFVGSEGTFGIVTEATLKLVPQPPAVRTLLAEFVDVNDASHAVSAIIAAGVMPAALEMMDHEIIRAVESSVFAAGLPTDIGAALLIELDGIEAGLDDEAARVTDICLEFGARACRRARDDQERKKLWAARKGAFGAIGRISPDSMIQDAVVPRSRLPEVLAAAYDIAARNQLKLANVFHAGDGNLHPLICFDSRFPDQVRRVKVAGRELMEVCVKAGGTITGEHGVGLDKRELLPLVFSETDMEAMLSVRAAFDPAGLLNPGKIIPMLRGCGEGRAILNDGADSVASDEVPQRLSSTPNGIKPSGSITQKAEPVPGHFNADRAATRLHQLVSSDALEVSDSITVYPNSVRVISEILKLASEEHWRVAAVGALRWNCDETNIVISTRRLNRITEHEPADLIAIAEAGMPLTSLNEVLGKEGQWIPLDPPNDGRATIGGVVATGLGGVQQSAYGRPRGSVIGLKAVLGDGTILKTGGRVVKNVAGYDLSKLLTGSFGSLGIITEINFKLRPRPQSEATLIAHGALEDLCRSGNKIIESQLFPVAVEVVSHKVADELGFDIGPLLLVRFAGTEKGVNYQMATAMRQCMDKLEHVVSIKEDGIIWQNLAALPVTATRSLRASMSRSVLPGKLAELKVLGEQAAWQAGLADGRIRIMELTADALENYAEDLKGWRNTLRRNQGTVTVEQGSAVAYGPTASESEPAILDLTQRIKMQLDPLGVFPTPRV